MFKSKSDIAIKPSSEEITEKPKNPCATVLWDYFDQWQVDFIFMNYVNYILTL